MSGLKGAWAGAEAPGGAALDWPASFLTGPLGSNNLLPSTLTTKFLGCMVGASGMTTADGRTWFENRRAAGVDWNMFQSHYGGDSSWDGVFGAPDPEGAALAPGGVTHEAYCHSNDLLCALVWSPNYTIAQVNAGTADAIFTKMFDYWAAQPNRIMHRLFHEFDAIGFTWGYGYSGANFYTGAEFVSAWQRVVGLRNASGATNVGFWWNPNEYLGGLSRNAMNAYYPGDSWVDWVGTDIYNHNTGTSSPLHSGWAEWWELFNYGQDAGGFCHYDIYSRSPGDPLRAVSGVKTFVGTAYTKPFVCGETSTPYDDGPGVDTSKKANWFRNVVNHAKALDAMANCVGVCFYDVDAHTSLQDYDWRVASDAAVFEVAGNDPDATTLAGVVDMASDPIFSG